MSLSRKSPDVVVSIDGYGPLEHAELLTVDMSLGGGTPDTAVFAMRYPDARNEFVVHDTELSAFTRINGANPIIVITIRDSTSTSPIVLHRGELVAVNWTNGPDGEWLTYTSRTDWHLLQTVADDASGPWPWVGNLQYLVGTSYDEREVPVFRGPVTFNPIVDSKTVPNCMIMDDGSFLMAWEESLHRVEPDADPGLQKWSLSDIVAWLLDTYNPNQKFARNASYDDIKSVLGNDRDLVRDLKVDITRPLASVLDDVLSPYGFTWYLNHNSPTGTMFAFVDKRAKNTSTTLRYPRWGEPAWGSFPTQGVAYDLQFDISSNAANLFALRYSGSVVEGSFELYPAWDKSLDSLEPDELEETDETVELSPERKRVFRDWVLNEDASYYKLADRRIGRFSGHNMLSQAFDRTGGLTNSSEVAVLRRREFLPMLTLDDDGSPKGSGRGGVEVEYSEDGGATWLPISDLIGNDHSISVLKNECGIRFSSGERPPEEFFSYRDKSPSNWWTAIKIRVTACVQGDSVMEPYVAPPESGMSWLPWRKTYCRDMGDACLAAVSEASKYHGQVRDGTLKASERARVDEALKHLYRMRDVYANASLTGTVRLHGLEHGQFYLGKCLGGIVGRNVWFNVSPPSSDFDMYPLVISVHYNIQNQEVVLTLETYRGE